MKIVVDNSKKESFLNERFISGAFLQSFLWKEFLEQQGKRSWQINVVDDVKIAFCLLYENTLPFGKSYLYAPKGPIFKQGLEQEKKEEAMKLILSAARNLSIQTKKREEIFFKFEANEDFGFIAGLKKTESVQPQETIFLQLDQEPKEMLAKMHPKTRYNISLAIKKGVKIEVSEQEDDLKYFLELNKKTSFRQEISTHSERYYQLLWQTLLNHHAGKLYLARHGKEVVAANLILNFGPTSTYLHGASNYQVRNLMAPHLLQWQAIKDAKTAGFLFYDFWGVAPSDGSKPKWDGFTRFKEGFGGQREVYPEAREIIYQESFYQFYQLSKKVKNFLRKK